MVQTFKQKVVNSTCQLKILTVRPFTFTIKQTHEKTGWQWTSHSLYLRSWRGISAASPSPSSTRNGQNLIETVFSKKPWTVWRSNFLWMGQRFNAHHVYVCVYNAQIWPIVLICWCCSKCFSFETCGTRLSLRQLSSRVCLPAISASLRYCLVQNTVSISFLWLGFRKPTPKSVETPLRRIISLLLFAPFLHPIVCIL